MNSGASRKKRGMAAGTSFIVSNIITFPTLYGNTPHNWQLLSRHWNLWEFYTRALQKQETYSADPALVEESEL
jgi:hypothetical protein